MAMKPKWYVEFSISGIEAMTEEEAIREARKKIAKNFGLVSAESYNDSCSLCGADKARNMIINKEFNGTYCDSCANDIKKFMNDEHGLPGYECINCGAKGMKESDVEADPTFWGNPKEGYTCTHCGYVHYPSEGEYMKVLDW